MLLRGEDQATSERRGHFAAIWPRREVSSTVQTQNSPISALRRRETVPVPDPMGDRLFEYHALMRGCGALGRNVALGRQDVAELRPLLEICG